MIAGMRSMCHSQMPFTTATCESWKVTRRRSPRLAFVTGGGELNSMAGNFKELQAKIDRASRADNAHRVREELQRIALEELRSSKPLTQSDMAEMLNVPQSSISRIEQRA